MQAARTPTRPLGALTDNRQNQPAGQQGTKQGANQAKRRTKASALCLTPPTVIQSRHGHEYQRLACIGEGGFARCFEVKNMQGLLYAAKTMAKSAIQTEKTRAKLLAEIKIHRALRHPNIVEFIDCFEDSENVYILLEMCPHQSLMDMVRRRKTLTEVEARYFMVQILGAIQYMHGRMVLHRDLKLGNIFIDSNMNLKIGDFGLAARLDSPLQRRKTVCGTPNYISPEVLMRPHDHSFPADLWAAGIILYAMLFGQPPFQEKQVDTIYQRIRDHDLRFPDGSSVSTEARDLVLRMLDHDQSSRLTVQSVLDHPWFLAGPFVDNLPVTALRSEPFLYATQEASLSNFVTVKMASGLTLDTAESGTSSGNKPVDAVTRSDLHQADVTHGTQILPPHISPPSTREKYQVVVMPDGKKAVADYDSPVVERLRQQPRHRVTSGAVAAQVPLATRTSTVQPPSSANTNNGASPMRPLMRPLSSRIASSGRSSSSGTRDIDGPVALALQQVKTLLASELQNVSAGTSAAYSHPDSGRPTTNNGAAVYVTKWADFDETWGLAYELTDGAVGVLFRDKTSMRMDPVFDSFMYYESRSRPGLVTYHRTAPNTTDVRRGKKVEVLRFVHNYMDERLGQATAPARPGGDCSDGVYVYKFRRLPQGFIMFVLSDGTLQFNFRDHNKIVLSDGGRKLTVITDQRQELTWPLATALAVSTFPHFARLGLESKLRAILAEL